VNTTCSGPAIRDVIGSTNSHLAGNHGLGPPRTKTVTLKNRLRQNPCPDAAAETR
jgi:hypothetical protein